MLNSITFPYTVFKSLNIASDIKAYQSPAVILNKTRIARYHAKNSFE